MEHVWEIYVVAWIATAVVICTALFFLQGLLGVYGAYVSLQC